MKLIITTYLLFGLSCMHANDTTIKVTNKYLNMPVSRKAEFGILNIRSNNNPDYSFKIRLATSTPDYWVFYDLTPHLREDIDISYQGNSERLKHIYQSDKAALGDSLYREKKRPQLHYTPQRGRSTDVNGLVYLAGTYHLFYQHNPYEAGYDPEYRNMQWGHAVSKDLIHWQELPDAIRLDTMGRAYSGTAVIDENNTAGFGKKTMVAIYTSATATRQVQNLAYSTDNGTTWKKYKNNPILDSRKRVGNNNTRDPQVFWHKARKHWVMVLFENTGNSIYTSSDLKQWTYQSHIAGFWECPNLIEMAVDEDDSNKKWVMFGGAGQYVIGRFDGYTFFPESGKLHYINQIKNSQTFVDSPDGRTIQMGTVFVSFTGMPFMGMISLPTELKLKRTVNGIQLFRQPVKELEKIQTLLGKWEKLPTNQANQFLKLIENQSEKAFRVKATIEMSSAFTAGLKSNNKDILNYSLNKGGLINDFPYSPPYRVDDMEISIDIFIDRSTVEVFIDNGAYSYIVFRDDDYEKTNLIFWGSIASIKNLAIYQMNSIWQTSLKP